MGLRVIAGCGSVRQVAEKFGKSAAFGAGAEDRTRDVQLGKEDLPGDTYYAEATLITRWPGRNLDNLSSFAVLIRQSDHTLRSSVITRLWESVV